MSEQGAAGPGVITTDDVGSYSIANTTLLTSRFTMAYAAGINDANPAYFNDLREGGLNIHPGICFSLQWASRFRPDQKFRIYGRHPMVCTHQQTYASTGPLSRVKP